MEAKRGKGRKRLAEGEITISVSLRVTQAQRDQMRLLGGAKWVRAQIDAARPKNGNII